MNFMYLVDQSVKVSLHAHPHFYNPGYNRKKGWDEKLFRMMRPMPSLKDIVEFHLKNRFGIGVISDCHTTTSGMDPRYKEYMKELNSLSSDFNVEYANGETRVIAIKRKKEVEGELPYFYLLRSQEVRTEENGKLADINIVGVKRDITHSLTPKETAKIGREEGGLVIVCHPNSAVSSLGLEKTKEFVESGKVHTYEQYNASESPEANNDLRLATMSWPRQGVSVSDSHHYRQINSAYISVGREFYDSHSHSLIDKLKELISDNAFSNHYGEISAISRHFNHTLPILLSLPGHFIKRPKEIIKYLAPALKKKN